MKGKTRKGAMTHGKSKEQQAKELKRQQEMRQKFGTNAPMEPVQKKAMGGKAIAGTLSPLYGAATGEGAFGEIGKMGLAGQLGRAYRRRKGEEEVMQNPRNVPVDSGSMAPAARAMKKGGMVTKGVDGIAMKGKTRAKRGK